MKTDFFISMKRYKMENSFHCIVCVHLFQPRVCTIYATLEGSSPKFQIHLNHWAWGEGLQGVGTRICRRTLWYFQVTTLLSSTKESLIAAILWRYVRSRISSSFRTLWKVRFQISLSLSQHSNILWHFFWERFRSLSSFRAL